MNPETVFKKLCEADPHCCLSHFTLGRYHYLEGRYSDALQAFEKAIDLDENYLLAYLMAAQACEKQGAHEQAITIYKKGESRALATDDQRFAKQFRALIVTGR